MEELQRKYGIWTATAMVIGIVIGSGVFFKADDVLSASGGRLGVAMLAWLIGGAIMMVTALVFAGIAGRIEKVNGVVDYFEEAYGEKAAYLVAWFMTFVYYPTLVAVLAWVSANYSMSLLHQESGVWLFAFIYMSVFFLLNCLSPVFAGRWQVSATVIKLIPLALVAVVGIISGLSSGMTMTNFATSGSQVADAGGLAMATLSTAFAYEGCIIATSINAELRDAKKTLPRALFFGASAVVLIYMLYYLGISGVLTNEEVLAAGNDAPLNGLIMGSVRGMYSIASRNLGPAPDFFRRIDGRFNSTIPSALLGYFLSCGWLVVWYGNFHGWWGQFMDISELPIAFLYVIYVSLYIWVMRSFTDLGFFGRFVAPLAAGCGSCYIIWGAIQKDMFMIFFLITMVILAIGLPFISDRK